MLLSYGWLHDLPTVLHQRGRVGLFAVDREVRSPRKMRSIDGGAAGVGRFGAAEPSAPYC